MQENQFRFLSCEGVAYLVGECQSDHSTNCAKGCGLRGFIYSEKKTKENESLTLAVIKLFPRQCKVLMPLPDLVCLISCMPKNPRFLSAIPEDALDRQLGSHITGKHLLTEEAGTVMLKGGLDYIFIYFSSMQSLSLRLNGIFASTEPVFFRVLFWQGEDTLQSWL